MHFRQKINPHITINWKLHCYSEIVSLTLNTSAEVNADFLTHIKPI